MPYPEQDGLVAQQSCIVAIKLSTIKTIKTKNTYTHVHILICLCLSHKRRRSCLFHLVFHHHICNFFISYDIVRWESITQAIPFTLLRFSLYSSPVKDICCVMLRVISSTALSYLYNYEHCDRLFKIHTYLRAGAFFSTTSSCTKKINKTSNYN